MKRKELDTILATYLPERQWVMRVGEEVYKLKLPIVLFQGAEVIKMRKWKMFKTLRARIGISLMDLGTALINSEWSKRYKPYSEVFERRSDRNG